MKRPIPVTVLSICNIVFGAIGLLAACIPIMAVVVSQMPVNPGQTPDDPYSMLLRENDGYRIFLLIMSLLGGMTSLLLLASGIGMLVRQGWARWLTVGWSGFRLLRIAVEVGVTAVIVVPFLATHTPPPDGQQLDPAAFALGMQGCCACMGLLPALYPIAALIVLFRHDATDWFRGEESTEVEPWNA